MGWQQSRTPGPDEGSPPANSAAAPLWHPPAGEVRQVPHRGRPAAVTAAFWLGVADVLVASALLAVKCLMSDQLVLQALGSADFLLAEIDLQEVYYGILSGVVLLAALCAAAWLALLLAMRRGHRWARALLTGFGFGWAVHSLVALVGAHPAGPVAPVLEAAQVLVLAGTLLAMHSPSARDHFT